MPRLKESLRLWGPSILMMALIFTVSAQPASALPNFSWADILVKKGGHMIGYGLLAVAYWRGLRFRPGSQPFAWLLVIAYAVTDEFHQVFVPGRHPSPVDVLLFDNLGAVLALLAWTRLRPRVPANTEDRA